MSKNEETLEKILSATTTLCALRGCEGISMRLVAKQIPISQSVIYHYYQNKEQLLEAVYRRANKSLGEARANLPQPSSAVEMLENLIRFQIQHAELIIAVLKYYLYNREFFAQQGSGTLPEKSSLHVEEVLEFGVMTKEFAVEDLEAESKVIAHSINGYLLEYFPHMPEGKEADELISAVVSFCKKALIRAGV